MSNEPKKLNESQQIIVDLKKALKSEGLEDRQFMFWWKFTPVLFNWIGWIFALGALKYLAVASGSMFVSASYWLCHFAVYFYFLSFASRIEIRGFPIIKSRKVEFFLSATISMVISFGFIFLSIGVASEIAALQAATP